MGLLRDCENQSIGETPPGAAADYHDEGKSNCATFGNLY